MTSLAQRTIRLHLPRTSITSRAAAPTLEPHATLGHVYAVRGSPGSRCYSMATSPSSKPLQVYTAGTPNGRKVHIFLEELKAHYGLSYEYARVFFN